ncbi:hypothetical protein PO909_033792 [Leuciscus waleckii]
MENMSVKSIAAQVKFTYDDESTLVRALPEPIENALQCLQFEKKKSLNVSLWEHSGRFSAIVKSPKKRRYSTERDLALIGLYPEAEQQILRLACAMMTL